MKWLTMVLLFVLNISYLRAGDNDYMRRRQNILNTEQKMRTGGSLILSLEENKVNDILMAEKKKEFQIAIKEGYFFPSMHFFQARKKIKKSKVFKILKQTPKGAALHIHFSALVDLLWIVKNVTYRSNCYMCITPSSTLLFYFFPKKPAPKPDCPWIEVNTLRKSWKDINKFDQMLLNNLSIIVDDPAKAYPSQYDVWNRFQNCFQQINGLLYYAPVFKQYFQMALEEFYNDNVQYMEIRGVPKGVYELNGTIHSTDWTLQTLTGISQSFKKLHSDFIGIKFIAHAKRTLNKTCVLDALLKTIELQKKYPNDLAGFDLVTQEDTGNPLIYYLDELLYPSQQNPPINISYFFHAGETDWSGTDIDRNLIDALLLNSSRIGHGYAATKHPMVIEMARKQNVAFEISPISNQVLGLLLDLRNHPASTYFSTDQPIVISSDDPAFWGASGLSYDFYAAFMALAGEQADLATIKQLAINSIRYSAMKETEKTIAFNLWQTKWNKFIKRIYNSSDFSELLQVDDDDDDDAGNNGSGKLLAHINLLLLLLHW